RCGRSGRPTGRGSRRYDGSAAYVRISRGVPKARTAASRSTVVDGFDVVAIGVGDKGGIVAGGVLLADARRRPLTSTGRERRSEEPVDSRLALGDEGNVCRGRRGGVVRRRDDKVVDPFEPVRHSAVL